MPGSAPEVQALADQILELLGVRTLAAGQLVIHYSEGRVQGCEVNSVYRARRLPLRRPVYVVDKKPGNGAG